MTSTADPVPWAREQLRALGLPDGDLHAWEPSTARFPDGAAHRIEIATAEGAAVIREIVATARELNVPVARATQGSGCMLLSDAEIVEMVETGRAHGIEVCLFVGPRGPWSGTASPHTASGDVFAWRNFGLDQTRHALADVARAVDLGARSICVADEGLLQLLAAARARGDLPENLTLKVSALLGVANPVQARILAELGADTLNVASDLTVAQLAALRAVIDIPIDIYIESPDNFGGFARYWEVADIVAAAAPVHLKFALKNAPGLYPSGRHLEPAAVLGARERVHRARAALDILERSSAAS